MKAANLTAAQAFCSELSKAMDRMPPYSMGDKANDAARSAECDKIMALFEANGGAAKVVWNGTTVRAYGIRASSTQGLMQACENWKVQVTLKSMAANMGGSA